MLQPHSPTTGTQGPPYTVTDADNAKIRERRKDDLFQFESTPVPRPADLCARYAGKVAPLWGFAVYGVLWFFVAFTMFALGMIPGYALGAAVGSQGAGWVHVLGFAGGVVMFVLAWVLYVRWAKRKRSSTLPLIRDGVVVEGRVFNKYAGPKLEVARRVVTDLIVRRLGVRIYRVEVTHGGMRYMLHVPEPTLSATPAPGTVMRALFHTASPHALVFDAKGKATVVRVR